MAMDVTIELPAEIAQELLDDDVAVKPVGSRSAAMTAQVLVEGVGVGANVATVLVAVAELPQIARRIVRWFQRHPDSGATDGSDTGTTIKIIRSGDTVHSVSISNAPDRLEVTIADVSSALRNAASP
jgi:hypothetical protein